MTYKYPVSIKGVVFKNGKAILLKNEREEWELPGGKIEIDETPEQCVIREVEEEMGVNVKLGDILDSWMYHIKPGIDVIIITYGCYLEDEAIPIKSNEHKEMKEFAIDEIENLNMPNGYKKSILNWHNKLRHSED